MIKRALLLIFILTLFLFPLKTHAEVEPSTPLTVNESFDSDLLTGSFVSSVPIKVPPGINGFQPNLSLTYNSRGGNGWLGVGWELSGLGYIELDPNARFRRDVKSLDCANHPVILNMNGTHHLVFDGTYYHTEIETFWRIERSGNSLTVTDKGGTQYRFGIAVAGNCGKDNGKSKNDCYSRDKRIKF